MANAHPDVKAVEGSGEIGCLMLFGLGWTLFSLFFMVMAVGVYVRDVREYRLLAAEGAFVTGAVTDLDISSDEDGDTYYVTYSYRVRALQGDWTVYSKRDSVGEAFYNSLRENAPVKVRYVPSDPNVAVLEANYAAPNVWFFVFMVAFSGLFVLVGVGLLYGAFKSAMNARRLQEAGQFVEGVVFDLWDDTDSDGDRHYYVGYEFRAAPTGGLTKTYQQGQRVDKSVYRTLQRGQAVRVRYWQEDPDVNRAELLRN
ncbi:MAG: hypothetical protein OHK0052_26770 [Anaerolineales bacterium]